MPNEPENHFILSREGYFWRPGGCGYTSNVFEAGLFTEKYATYVEDSGRRDRLDKAIHISERASEIRAGAQSAPKLLALIDPTAAPNAKQALLSLADWIEKQYRLGESAKVRLASAPETIYAEIVKRLATLSGQS